MTRYYALIFVVFWRLFHLKRRFKHGVTKRAITRYHHNHPIKNLKKFISNFKRLYFSLKRQ